MCIKNYEFIFWVLIFFISLEEVSASDNNQDESGEIVYSKSNNRPGGDLTIKFPLKSTDSPSESMWMYIKNTDEETVIYSNNSKTESLSPSTDCPQEHFSKKGESNASKKIFEKTSTFASDQDKVELSMTLNYFKVISDASPFLLKSKTSTDPSSGEIISPKSTYRPGFDLSLKFPLKVTDWQSEMIWTSIQNTSKETVICSNDYTIFSLPPSPSIASPQGHFSKKGTSNTSVGLNVFDWHFNNPIKIKKSLTITPMIGFESFFIEQNVKTNYKEILPAGPFELTSCVRYKNNNWGVGPLIGASINLVFPYKIIFSLSSKFSSMFGESKSITYFDNLNAPNGKYKSNEDKLFYHSKMQASLIKESVGSRFVLRLVAGWETNVFSKQLNEKYYGNVTTGKSGSDLTLQGPFFKVCLAY